MKNEYYKGVLTEVINRKNTDERELINLNKNREYINGAKNLDQLVRIQILKSNIKDYQKQIDKYLQILAYLA